MSVSGVDSSGSSASSSSTATSGVSPTNTGTISFGDLGGFNYSQIIQQLTAVSQRQEVPYQNKITQVNAQNSEITSIQNNLATLQSTLQALSDPTTFKSYKATPSDSTVLTATAVAGQTPVPGTYTITATTLGTATNVVGSATIGHKLSDLLAGVASNTIPLADSYAQITPSNGSTGVGSVTIDGVKVSYDATSQSLNQILANIQTAVRAAGDASFTASYNSGTDKVTLSSTTQPLSVGSPNDSGNLLSVLKLDVAGITNTASSGTVTSADGVGGVDQYENFNSVNAQGHATDANFITPVTAGVFTVNGTQISVTTGEALSDVLSAINSSGAGVTASFDAEGGNLTLTNSTVGAQSIVVGSSGDTSNFLTAAGLTTAAGGTTHLGSQSSLQFTDTSGTPHTVFSNSNVVSSAIPGFNVTILKSTGVSSTVTVAQSSSTAESAINTFVSAYNNVVNQLNTDLAAPVVTQGGVGSAPNSSQSLGGGVLFGNQTIEELKNDLVNIVSSQQSGTTQGYNSLSSIGLQLTSSFQVLESGASSGSSVSGSSNTSSGSNTIGLQTLQGTDGTFQPLDATTFEAAYAANPNAVANIFTNSANFVNQLGTKLTSETGLSTVLASGLAGTAPTTSVLAGLQQQNQAIITSNQNQLTQIQQQITEQANQLQTEYAAASATMQQLQGEQTYLSAIGGSSSSSG